MDVLDLPPASVPVTTSLPGPTELWASGPIVVVAQIVGYRLPCQQPCNRQN